MMITQEYLKECFSYDKESGYLVWIDRPINHFRTGASYKRWRTMCFGKKIGSVKLGDSGKRYLLMRLNQQMLRVHRVIWMIVTGDFPKDQIDHINGDGLDNRWENLREVTHLENCKNVKLMSHNTSGYSGVSFHTSKNRWRVEIGVDGKNKILGLFKDKTDAIICRKMAEIEYGYHSNHGEKRDL